jgi:hypothetical protein
VEFFVLKSQPTPGRCCVRLCRNEAEKHRRFCRRCRQRRFMEDNPVSYTFSQLKKSARRRGIPFLLSMADWESFCEATGYHYLRGRTADELSIDRKRDGDPYSIDNIQILTVSENTAKGNRERHLSPARQRYARLTR